MTLFCEDTVNKLVDHGKQYDYECHGMACHAIEKTISAVASMNKIIHK